jgi:hypothetical protein
MWEELVLTYVNLLSSHSPRESEGGKKTIRLFEPSVSWMQDHCITMLWPASFLYQSTAEDFWWPIFHCCPKTTCSTKRTGAAAQANHAASCDDTILGVAYFTNVMCETKIHFCWYFVHIDSSVSMATKLCAGRPRNQSLISARCKRYSFLHSVQTSSGASLVSCSIGHIPGVKLPGCEADHPPQELVELYLNSTTFINGVELN